MAVLRLDKYLADMGCGTRTQVKEYIRKGRIRINDLTVKKPEIKINTEKDSVFFDEKLISYVEFEYYMLNKPQNVISATEDKNERTVIDLIDSRIRKDLFPVGRLDKDTEGLLLITNDGQLAHKLLSPKKHVDKVYYAEIDNIVTDDMADAFEKGILIADGVTTMPSKLVILSAAKEHSAVMLTIHEGKFHQVKRMFEAFDMKVTYLKRLSMGPLKLDEGLKPGDYRCLTLDEINILYECVE